MTVPPTRWAVLDTVADLAARGPVRVGIDGVDGAGKTTFADDLAAVLRERGRPVVRIGVDDFLFPPEHRYLRGRHDPEGFFLDSFDFDAFDPDHPRMRRYVEGQRIYFRRCRPQERADVAVEHSDPLAPRLVRLPHENRLPS